ncbi:MAG TPA: 30S ribosomal protein S21 [Bacilli bacterium]|nr:30S ribosomal protein S21 [Bacilli bacterium]
MTKVEVRNGNIDGALKRFKTQVAKSGIPSEIKKRKHYEKPGVKKRNEKKENIKNARKHNKNKNRN